MKLRALLLIFLIPVCCSAQTPVVCDLTYVTTLQTFNVYHHDPTGVTLFKAKMYIDADGSPRAYGPNNSGLDWTANAGSPGNWWGIVTDGSGNPILQGSSDPYPGMYVSTTSLVNTAYTSTNPLRYTNSETVPFYVLPSSVVSSGGISIGDVAYVYNTVTGQGCYAIYADAGPSTSLGEGSIYLASQIGVNPNARTGGTSSGIIDYIVFPQSGFGQGYIPSIAQIDSIGNLMIQTVGGTGITVCLNSSVANDNTAPTTQISTSALWDTTNFTAGFNDADNAGGSGIEKRFYQVSDLNTEWRANNAHGFFNDEFVGPSINPEWTNVSGAWNINASGFLEESNETNGNTNLYAPLTQNLSNRYLYHWTGIIKGSGTNRRAGFHFFCDQPDSTNRGNSYFVYFRLDGQRIQIYKSINNSWGSGPVKDVACSFTANTAYDFKVIYDRISGLIKVYVNDVMSAEWIDPSPISNGSYISFRNAGCNYQVNDFRVYRSRNASASISVGTGNTHDIRFQNPNPSTYAGCIRSIVTDTAGNISSSTFKKVNIDWTAPTSPLNVNDGVAADADTTFNGTQLQSNWSACADPNSGIRKYYYAVGTAPGLSDLIPWTATSLTSINVTGLSLSNLQTYYTSVRSEDSALIKSPVVTSDGQIYYSPTTMITEKKEAQTGVSVYPNPGNGLFHLKINVGEAQQANITVTDITGRVISVNVLNINSSSVETDLDIYSQKNGMYYVIVDLNGKKIFKKIILSK